MTITDMLVMRTDLATRLSHSGIPSYMHESLLNYIMYGTAPGGFLVAVLCNNLTSACNLGDTPNRNALSAYVEFLYSYAPVSCWREPECVIKWMAQGGMTHKEEA